MRKKIRRLNRMQTAVVLGQGLSFLLIIAFIFANQRFDLLSGIGGTGASISLKTAYVSSCLVGLVGAVSTWITLHYLTKSNAMRELLVVCAWTQRIKVDGGWISFREFLSRRLGYTVSDGICDAKVEELRRQVRLEWKPELELAAGGKRPMGIQPAQAERLRAPEEIPTGRNRERV